MRRVETPLGASSSIGFGCASLGSRVGGAEGARAIANAYAAGITWFDVAPSYGDGQAEPILGRVVAPHRDDVVICTKVGIRAPAVGLKGLLKPVARRVISAAPFLRKYATRARSVENVRLTPEFVRASLDASLKRLGVEQIDLLMLHDPAPADVARQDVLDALQAARASGKIRAFGVAGDVEAAAVGAARPEIFSVLQFANNPFEPNLLDERVRPWREAGGFIVTHSALGANGALAALKTLLARSAKGRELVSSAGYDPDSPSTAADVLIDYAIASNISGVSLFSAMKPAHLAALSARADRAPNANDTTWLGLELAGLVGGQAT